MPEGDGFMRGRSGEGRYLGASVSVLPLRVSGEDAGEVAERTMRLLDALQDVVDGFEGAEVIDEVTECLECVDLASAMYRAKIAQLAAEVARRQ
jgi:predicted nucleotidyltransferase